MVQLVVWWRQGLTASHRIGRSEILLLAFVGVLAANVALNDWSVDRNVPLSQLFFNYLMPLGIYCVGWQARISERGVKTMFALLGVFGVYLALTAIAERAIAEGWELKSLVFPPYILTSKYEEFLGRARGPLLNPAANGMLLGTCLAAGLMAWPRAQRWGRLGLIAYSGLLSVAIACTMTRSAWMGGALGLFLLLFLTLPRSYRPALVAAAVLGSAVLVATQWTNLVEFKRDTYAAARRMRRGRPICARAGPDRLGDVPRSAAVRLRAGALSREHRNYLSNHNVDLPLERGRGIVQHNTWLSLLTETGLIGAVLFALVMIAWLASAWWLWRSDDAPLCMRQQGLLFLILAGKLPCQRDVPGHDDHPDGPHDPLLLGRRDREPHDGGGGTGPAAARACDCGGAWMTASSP